MKNLVTFCVLILVLVLNGCSKYEDGPNLSLRTKKGRLVNKWKWEKVFVNGKESMVGGQPPSAYDFWVEFKNDNTYENFHGLDGDWEFDDSKENVILTSDPNFELTFKILKLKNNELWIEYKNGNELYEEHYENY